MTTSTPHPLALRYLEDLRRSAARLPRGRRDELVAEITEHLAEAIESDASDAEVLTVLDRLGDPEEIVEAEQPRPAEPAEPPGTREAAAIFLLLLGGFIAGVGWLVGLIFLWGSRCWTTRDKWIGTLVIPGGLAGSWFVFIMTALPATGAGTCVSSAGGTVHCTHGAGLATNVLHVAPIVIAVLAPFVTAAYLVRRARRHANQA